MPDLYKIAHEADVIDNGFAFKKIPEGIRVGVFLQIKN